MFAMFAMFAIFGMNAVNPAGLKTPNTWKEVEAVGATKTHDDRKGLVNTVEFDFSNIQDCLEKEVTVTYFDLSKRPHLALSVPIAEKNGKYKLTSYPEAQKQIVMHLKCGRLSFKFTLIE